MSDNHNISSDAEDMALAIGHVILSHNSLQHVLMRLGMALWAEDEASAMQRRFGRRSVDERLGMLAQQLNKVSRQPVDWLDKVDRLLATCRSLTERRNLLVHSYSSLDLSLNYDDLLNVQPPSFDFDAAMALSDELDQVAQLLFDLCLETNRAG